MKKNGHKLEYPFISHDYYMGAMKGGDTITYKIEQYYKSLENVSIKCNTNQTQNDLPWK